MGNFAHGLKVDRCTIQILFTSQQQRGLYSIDSLALHAMTRGRQAIVDACIAPAEVGQSKLLKPLASRWFRAVCLAVSV
jgi:hypothetical protein